MIPVATSASLWSRLALAIRNGSEDIQELVESYPPEAWTKELLCGTTFNLAVSLVSVVAVKALMQKCHAETWLNKTPPLQNIHMCISLLSGPSLSLRDPDKNYKKQLQIVHLLTETPKWRLLLAAKPPNYSPLQSALCHPPYDPLSPPASPDCAILLAHRTPFHTLFQTYDNTPKTAADRAQERYTATHNSKYLDVVRVIHGRTALAFVLYEKSIVPRSALEKAVRHPLFNPNLFGKSGPIAAFLPPSESAIPTGRQPLAFVLYEKAIYGKAIASSSSLEKAVRHPLFDPSLFRKSGPIAASLLPPEPAIPED